MSNIKYSNCIIVGGTIAAGKSSLVEGLEKKLGFVPIYEYDEKNKLQTLILKKLYEGDRVHIPTTQFFFTSLRYKQYEEGNGLVTSILDRSLWEDYFFAKLLMGEMSKDFKMYKNFWSETINKMITEVGYPKAYIFLKVDWDAFKDRIYSRNREIEIANFYSNQEYFKNLLNEYNMNFENMLKDFNINVITIDTSKMSKEESLDHVIAKLREKKIIE